MENNEILFSYLQNEWNKNNAPKYQKYFKEWVSNLTQTQILYYTNLWMNKNK